MDHLTIQEAAALLFLSKTAAYYAVITAAVLAPIYVFLLEGVALDCATGLGRCSGNCWAFLRDKYTGNSKRGRKSTGGRKRAAGGGGVGAGLAAVRRFLTAMSAALCRGCAYVSDWRIPRIAWPTANTINNINLHDEEDEDEEDRNVSVSPTRGSGKYDTPKSRTSPTPAKNNNKKQQQSTSDDEDDDSSSDSGDDYDGDDLVVVGRAIHAPSSSSSSSGGRRTDDSSNSAADPAIMAAMASGEVCYQRARPATTGGGVHSIEARVRGLFRRQRTRGLYAQTNTTPQALEELFGRPAFHAWYDENRPRLMNESQVRRNGLHLRSLATFLTLLLGLFALPAFSFSNKARVFSARQAPVGQATFGQLLVARGDAIRARTAATLLPAVITRGWGGGGVVVIPEYVLRVLVACIGQVEIAIMCTAVLGLVTTAFMPHGRKFTATAALWALAVIMVECVAMGGEGAVSTRIGMGVGVVFGVVAADVATAFQ